MGKSKVLKLISIIVLALAVIFLVIGIVFFAVEMPGKNKVEIFTVSQGSNDNHICQYDGCYQQAQEGENYCIDHPNGKVRPSGDGDFLCCGKNDTCPNHTSSPYDLYCSSCDRNNNNVEDIYE